MNIVVRTDELVSADVVETSAFFRLLTQELVVVVVLKEVWM